MSILKKLAGETIIYGIGAVLPRAMNFLLVASYLTFTMDRSNYGIYGILYAYVTVAMCLFTMRMETAFFKFGALPETRQKAYNATLSIVITSSTFLLGLIIIFNDQLAHLLTRPEDGRFIIYFGLILFFDAIASIPYASLRLESRPIKFASIKVANSILTIGMILFCFEILPRYFPAYYDEEILLDYAFIPNVIASGLVLLLLFKELSDFQFKWDKDLWQKLIRYSWPLIIVGVAGSINQFSDRLFVAYLTGNESGDPHNFASAGLYTGAIKIASLMSLFITAFNYTIEPFFFKNSSTSDREKIYGPVAKAYTIIAAGLFLLIGVNLDIFQFIIGKDFREGIFIVPVAMMSFLILGLYYNISIWYKLSGQTKYGALIAVIGTIVLILSNLLFIPKYGMIGATYASLICFSTMCVIAYFIGQKKYPIKYPLGSIFMYLGLAIGFYILFLYIPLENSKLRFWLGNGLLVVYGLIAYLLDYKKLKAL